VTGFASLFFYLAVMILTIGGILFLYGFRSRRAIFKVLEIFCRHGALGVYEAKSLCDLGLERPDFIQRMVKPRDYKQYALQILVKQGIISVNEEGEFYLLEDRLEPSLRRKVSELRAKERP
jgi:hypothetical protein